MPETIEDREQAVYELVTALDSSHKFHDLIQKKYEGILDSQASLKFKKDILNKIDGVVAKLVTTIESAWFSTDLTNEEIRLYTEFAKSELGKKIIDHSPLVANAIQSTVNTELTKLDTHIENINTILTERGTILLQ